MATVSVVVPSHGRPDDLARCIAGLRRQTRAPEAVIVVVRDGDEATRRSAEEQAGDLRLSLVTVGRPGQVAALNAGLAAVGTTLVAFTDDDAVPRREWVERITARFSADPRLGALGGRDVMYREGATVDGQVRRVGTIRWFGRRVGGHHLQTSEQEVEVLKGANMSYRAAALTGFDPRLKGAGAEDHNDMEVSLGVKSRGWRVLYDPELVVDHYQAPRHDGLGRGRPETTSALWASVHNETYAALKWLPWWKKLTVFVYGIVVGYRHAPGLGLGCARVLRCGPSRGEPERMLAALRARLRAVATLLQR